ncbi:polymer-forming cytoskeletal protein [Natronomonas salina]|uniref:polymer-forming cytoskeletal protein n=1 Tax=Natronomonas salina TaxID=1710540 RepID=UPI001BA76385|nr:polymer-forming cytoskeletal protein [Natronomonas salina]
MFGSDPLEELSIPDGTHVQEHDLVTDGDVLVGGQSVVELGVRGGNVVAGERVRFGGDIEADGDCRLDMWCDVDGNVLVGQDAYLGERVHITGQLIVSGDLDIGDDVDIERGFEANGWIVIRNPMPTIVFLFVYLSQLLRIGEEEAAEEVAEEFLAADREADPLMIPRGARVSDDAWRVSTPATIGDDCRVHGNIRATEIEVGRETEVFGSLRAKTDIHVGPGTIVHGDVTTKGGDVVVSPGAHVRGDISCEDCRLSEVAEVDGTIRAHGRLVFEDAPEPEPEAESESDDELAGADDEAALEDIAPAVVPLGEGELPEPDPEPAFVRLGDGRLDVEATPAVRPVAESEFEWGPTDETVPSTNGSGDDVEKIIADAEDG